MLVVVIVLIVTNVATLGALAYVVLRPPQWLTPDPGAAASLDRATRSTAGGTRRLITVEILNPIELAGTRGRLAGIAGSLAPGVTRRIVHDQVLKQLRAQLRDQQVVADVRVHTVRPADEAVPAQPSCDVHSEPAGAAAPPASVEPRRSDPQPPGDLPERAGDDPRT